MGYIDEFLSYCRTHLVQPMYEAVGRAYVTLIRPAMGAIFEAAGKTPRESTRDVIVEELGKMNGGDTERVDGAMITVGDGAARHEVTVKNYIEESILGFIQRYGRTGRLERASMDQTVSGRLTTAWGNRLATAMLDFEPGIARILIGDMRALGHLVPPDALARIIDATGITITPFDGVDIEEYNRFISTVLPTFIRGMSPRFTGDPSGEWKPVKGPTVLSDLSYQRPGKGAGRVNLTYDDIIDFVEKNHDVRDPLVDEEYGTDASVAQATPQNVGHCGPSPDYDIYYIPNPDSLVKLIADLREKTGKPIYMNGLSIYPYNSMYEKLHGDRLEYSEKYGPWCLADGHWNTYSHSGSRYYSCYALMRHDWADVNADTNGTRDFKRLSAICCMVTQDGRIASASDRIDNSMGGSEISVAAFKRLLKVNDIGEALKWRGRGNENASYEHVGEEEAAAAASQAMAIGHTDYDKLAEDVIDDLSYNDGVGIPYSLACGDARLKIVSDGKLPNRIMTGGTKMEIYHYRQFVSMDVSSDNLGAVVYRAKDGKMKLMGRRLLTSYTLEQVSEDTDVRVMCMRFTYAGGDSSSFIYSYRMNTRNCGAVAMRAEDGNYITVTGLPDTVVHQVYRICPVSGSEYLVIYHHPSYRSDTWAIKVNPSADGFHRAYVTNEEHVCVMTKNFVITHPGLYSSDYTVYDLPLAREFLADAYRIDRRKDSPEWLTLGHNGGVLAKLAFDGSVTEERGAANGEAEPAV